MTPEVSASILTRRVRGAKKDARKYLTAKLREIDLGIFVEPANIALSEFLDKWLEQSAKPRITEATYNSYETMLRVHVKPKLGDFKLCDIQPLDIQSVYGDLQKSNLSSRTIRYAHSVLSMALKQAVTWNLLVKNPCSYVDLPRHEKKEMKAFSKDEAKRFIEAAKQDTLGIILECALTTGMRPEEYLALQWSDIDLNYGTATVQRALVWRKGGGWMFKAPKTKSSRRSIPLPLPLLNKIKSHRIKQAENRLKLGGAYENNNLVFATDLGTPIRYGNLDKRHFRPTLKLADLPTDFRLYDLRHSCATLLLAAGLNVKVVSERLGHANIKMTLETYAHVLPGMQEEATNQMAQMLYG